MRIADWFVVDDSAAERGLYVHFRNIGTYLLQQRKLLYRGPPPHQKSIDNLKLFISNQTRGGQNYDN